MRALITNDDGIDSQGLVVLAGVARSAGLDVVLAAPSWDSSGASASLTTVAVDGRVQLERREFDALEGCPAFAVDATPAFIVRLALTGAFGPPPDVVLSGINHGLNAGRAVLHSGTVGAALTAANHGLPALAMSVEASPSPPWPTVRFVAGAALDELLSSVTNLILNVNVPATELDQIRPLRRAPLATHGSVTTTITERGVGFVKIAHEPDADERDAEPGSDVAMLAAGHPTYTPLLAVSEDRGAALWQGTRRRLRAVRNG